MALYTNHYTPSSPFYTSHAFSDRFNDLRRNPFVTKSPSTAYRRSSQFTDDIVNRLDHIDTLGGSDGHDNLIGHTGCVNALAWSPSGHCLATGSDDRRIILWKLGSSNEHPRSLNRGSLADTRGYPRLDMAQSDVIETGHRANIFNVKWAPNCSDQRLFTCAGDNQVRVFDLSRGSSAVDQRLNSGKEYKLWEEDRGACIRVLKCHSGRAKKISTENSPDVFLTAAEDGEVRQTDLRVPVSSAVRQRRQQQLTLHLFASIPAHALKVTEPWLFAISGTSSNCYLQDRRMIPRLLKNEWGSHIDEETAALTHCVRRFCREPLPADEEQSKSRAYERAHVTAVKISEANGRDLLASYSGDGVYRFDIKGDPGISRQKDSSMLHTNKRRKTSSGSNTPQPASAASPTSQPEETASATPQPDEKASMELTKVRKRIIQMLFQPESGADALTENYVQLLQDLDQLDDAMPEDWPQNDTTDQLLYEEGIIALCRMLIYIKRTTVGQMETQDIDLESYKSSLMGTLTQTGHYELLPVIEELQEANRSRNYSEEVKIRMLLWDRAEEYVKEQWGADQRSEEGDSESDIEMQQASSSFRERLSAIFEADFSSESEQDARILEELDALNEIDSEEDVSEDDDINEEDDDDDDEDAPQFSESDEEVETNRHGISGGNAPMVYPNGCFTGHANNETVKDCGFIGSNDEYIWSGSDCGHFFIWTNDDERRLMGIWKGDDSVVNALTQHPVLPICAVSGIDDEVKIFGPVSHGSHRVADAMYRREEIIRRNSRQERIGFNPQRIRQMFARQMGLSHGIGAGDGLEEEEDCTIM